MTNKLVCLKCGFGYDADKFLTCPAVHKPLKEMDYHDEFDSYSKEIERLREDLKRLQSDKIALSEMLERTREYIITAGEYDYSCVPNIVLRISALLTRMKS